MHPMIPALRRGDELTFHQRRQIEADLNVLVALREENAALKTQIDQLTAPPTKGRKETAA